MDNILKSVLICWVIILTGMFIDQYLMKTKMLHVPYLGMLMSFITAYACIVSPAYAIYYILNY